MGFFNFKKAGGSPVSQETPVDEKNGNGVERNVQDQDSDHSFQQKQDGVRRVEATTAAWSQSYLIAAYGFIWLIYFVTSIQEVVTRAMNPFVTSHFQRHSLTAAVGVMSSIIGGLSKIPLAKLLDTWGRPQGLALSLFFWVVGLIMMAGCNTVETYAAAQVFSSVGSQGVSYCLTIFVADTSALVNRALMLSFATSPYIVTTWCGGPIAEAVLKGPGFRWGFGIWTIVTPVVVLPLSIIFLLGERKAKRAGLIEERKTKLTLAAVKKYCIDVDLFGILILAAGMALFLLPFNIYSYQHDGWHSTMIICMIVFGAVLIAAFAVWERFYAPVTFIPFKLLADRTVFFGGMMFVFAFAASSIWGSFFSSMLLVVWDTGITKMTYISNIYRVGSCFASLIIGFIIRYLNRYKWVGAIYALPLMLLGVGLMIKFRSANESLGYVIMTQVFVAFAGGPLVIAGEMAMMTPSDHQHIAVIIAVLDLFASIGGAVGGTISSAIWTSTFLKELKKRLPADAPLAQIYGDVTVQTSYAVGSAMRIGISEAYGASQRLMLITSVVLIAVAWMCTWMWRDMKLRSKEQVKGNVV